MVHCLKKYLGIGLFVLAVLIAAFHFDAYGISWDEEAQRRTGIISYEYVFSGDQTLLAWHDRDYGVGFELPLIIIERLFHLTDSRTIYLTRHFLTHLFFLLSGLACFLLVDLLYKNKFLAVAGFLLIVLHPRLYAHSFFNTKDIPFMAMFTICLYLNALAFSKKSWPSFLLLGIGVGLLINLRIMGLLVFCLVLFFLLIDLVVEKKYQHNSVLGAIFITASLTTLFITWPFLWQAPVDNFLLAFANMSRFRWGLPVLMNGEFIKATELSWYYAPQWFSMTTPVVYLALGIIGIGVLAARTVTAPHAFLTNTVQRNNIFFLICFFSPVIAVIALHSVLYDGWRQLYFIYPPFALLALYGLHFLARGWLKALLPASFLGYFLLIVIFMINNHPFQHIYFNELMDTRTPEYLRWRFELDYWGTSYKQSLEYILQHDDSPIINVAAENHPGVANRNILRPADRQRLNYVDADRADYYITNYRWHPQDYEGLEEARLHSVKVGNNRINSVYRLR